MMHTEKAGKSILLFLYLAIAAVIWFRVSAQPAQYISTDSKAYLATAFMLRHVYEPTKTEALKKKADPIPKQIAIWPAGYAGSIALVALVTNTSVVVASKLVNLLFLGFIFILLYLRFGKYAWLPSLYFCTFGVVEVFSFTWSEGPFLFFVIGLAFLLTKDLQRPRISRWHFLAVAGCLLLLFLFRYAGIIYFFLVGLFMVWHFFQDRKPLARQYFLALVLASAGVIAYLLHNHYQTGFYTGADRLLLPDESLPSFLNMLVRGVGSQLFPARHYNFGGFPDVLFLLLLALQLLVLAVLIWYRKLITRPFFDPASLVLIFTGLFYLAGIIVLRRLSPFDKFDFRILAPFAAPVFIGLLYAVTRHENFFRKTWPWIAAFFGVSLLMKLPKQFLLEQVQYWF